MNLPFFYIEDFDPSKKEIVLEEDTSRHVVQVLRMKETEKINLTDGKGNLITAEITDGHKKHCIVRLIDSRVKSHVSRKITIAISLLKNASRFEWFLEKATELGVNEIVPLLCERTEKQKFRYDRMQGICISAMLQSQQTWLPVLHEPKQFSHLAVEKFNLQQKFVAHCDESPDKKQLSTFLPINPDKSVIILIGPEGDFSKEEIDLALQNNFIAVSLGKTRLRTETAGIMAATLLCHI